MSFWLPYLLKEQSTQMNYRVLPHPHVISIPYSVILFSEALENHWTLEEMLLTLCRSIIICLSVQPHKGKKHHKTAHIQLKNLSASLASTWHWFFSDHFKILVTNESFMRGSSGESRSEDLEYVLLWSDAFGVFIPHGGNRPRLPHYC